MTPEMNTPLPTSVVTNCTFLGPERATEWGAGKDDRKEVRVREVVEVGVEEIVYIR